MKHRQHRLSRALSVLALSLLMAGFAGIVSAGTGFAQDSTPSAGTPSAGVETDVQLDCTTVKPLKIAFFGFAVANGFAQATWAGIQEAAKLQCAEAKFFDPNFDSAKQIAQIQDATTSGEYQAFVIQANDGNAVVPAIQEAIAAGIKVVAEFTPVGTDYNSIEPQVDGMTAFVGASSVQNGKDLAKLAQMACAKAGTATCNVAYLEGFKALPLDNARTKAFTDTLAADANIKLVASVEGGYTQASGLAAAQDVLQAHADVQVMVGSSQAILGAEQAVSDAGMTGKVLLIGNGAPKAAVTAVREGRWFAIFADAESTAGKVAATVALKAARGETVPTSIDTTTLLPTPLGTLENLPADYTGQWDA